MRLRSRWANCNSCILLLSELQPNQTKLDKSEKLFCRLQLKCVRRMSGAVSRILLANKTNWLARPALLLPCSIQDLICASGKKSFKIARPNHSLRIGQWKKRAKMPQPRRWCSFSLGSSSGWAKDEIRRRN